MNNTGETMKLPEDIRRFFAAQGSIGGKKRSANLSPERRREIARKAISTRWAKKKSASQDRAKSARKGANKPSGESRKKSSR